MNMVITRLLGLSAGLCCAASVVAAQQGTLIRAADLKARPQIDAPTVKPLAENTPLQVLGNDGGWSQVSTGDGKQGWVRLLNIRLSSDNSGSGNVGKDIAALGNVVRTGSTGASATTAAKGANDFTEDGLENATPNPAEVKKLDIYRATKKSATAYAQGEKLLPRDVPELKP